MMGIAVFPEIETKQYFIMYPHFIFRKQKNKILAYSLSNNGSISSLEIKPRHNQCTQRSKSTENKFYRYGNSKKG